MTPKKRIKILIVASDYPSVHDSASGVFFREQARAIAMYNDVTVLCFYSRPVKASNLWKAYRVNKNTENGIPTIRFEYPKIWEKMDGLNYLLIIIYSIFLVRKEGPFDIIHAQKFFPSGLVGYALKKKYKSRLVVTEHAGDFKHSMRSLLRRISIKNVMKNSNRVIAVSSFLANSIKEYATNLKIEVVPNPVNTKKFCVNFRQNAARKNKKILHISDLKTIKGIHIIIEAADKLRKKRSDFVIIIIGGKRKPIKKWRDSLKFRTDFIKFLGEMNHEEIASYMRACDFFILPSLRESFGAVLIEAMACGKPVLTTRCGGPEEIVSSDVGIIIPPNDVDSLTNALDYMLDNYHEFDSEIIAKFAADNFSYDVVGRRLDFIYREILASPLSSWPDMMNPQSKK